MSNGSSRIYVFRPSGRGIDPESWARLKVIIAVLIGLYAVNLLLLGTDGVIRGLIKFSILIPVILFSLSFHEAAHGYVADFLGDPTPRHQGRLTLNPMKHLDVIGTVMMLFSNMGWAKPVQVDSRNFRVPLRAMLSVAIAGPAANVFLALLGAGAQKLLEVNYPTAPSSGFFILWLKAFCETWWTLNLGLACFNLVPIPPLDGSRILNYFLPASYREAFRKLEAYDPLLLMILIYAGLVQMMYLPVFEWSANLVAKLYNL